MEFDQMYTGSLDWNFPSPTATPTTTNFGNNVLQTPKTSTFPSHFQDAFSTPQMGGFATPQQQFPSMTPLHRPQASTEALGSNFFGQTQMNNGQGNRLQSHSDYQGMGMGFGSTQKSNSQVPSLSPAFNPTFDSSQMQTPPPTRGTMDKQQKNVSFGNSNTVASRRITTPQQQPMQDHSAFTHQGMQFPQMQFSPSNFQFGNLGPASAPVKGHSQVMWGQPPSPGNYAQQRSLDDPFAPVQAQDPWQMTSMENFGGQDVSFDFNFQSQTAPRASSAAPMTGNMTGVPGPTQTSSASVDPSLLYSSPIRPLSRSLSSRPSKGRAEAAIKRKDSANFNNARAELSAMSDNAASTAAGGLRRSSTIGTGRGERKHPGLAPSDSLTRSNSTTHIPRTSSPLKRGARPSLGAITENKVKNRSSIMLTVDENGRAHTVTRPSEESPTQTLRDRYPGLYDDDSSDEESSGRSVRSVSGGVSVNQSKGDERKSRATRLEAPIENLEGLNIPRASSAASMRGVTPSRAALAAAASLRRKGSVRKPTSARKSLKRHSMFGSAPSLVDSCPMDISMDMSMSMDHNANSSGSEVISPASTDSDHHPVTMADDFRSLGQNLSASTNTNTGNANPYNRRWSMMSFDQPQPQPQQSQSISPQRNPHMMMPVQQQQHHQQQQQPTFSMNGAQRFPQSQPQRQVGPMIRCLCGVTSDQGQMLVQCVSCTQCLHATCVGLNGRQIPQNFTCFLCTKPNNGIHSQRRMSHF